MHCFGKNSTKLGCDVNREWVVEGEGTVDVGISVPVCVCISLSVEGCIIGVDVVVQDVVAAGVVGRFGLLLCAMRDLMYQPATV